MVWLRTKLTLYNILSLWNVLFDNSIQTVVPHEMFDDAGDVHHVLYIPVLEHVGHGVLHLELVGGGLVLAAPQLDRDSILAHGGGGEGDVVSTFCLSVALLGPTVLFTIVRSVQFS